MKPFRILLLLVSTLVLTQCIPHSFRRGNQTCLYTTRFSGDLSFHYKQYDSLYHTQVVKQQAEWLMDSSPQLQRIPLQLKGRGHIYAPRRNIPRLLFNQIFIHDFSPYIDPKCLYRGKLQLGDRLITKAWFKGVPIAAVSHEEGLFLWTLKPFINIDQATHEIFGLPYPIIYQYRPAYGLVQLTQKSICSSSDMYRTLLGIRIMKSAHFSSLVQRAFVFKEVLSAYSSSLSDLKRDLDDFERYQFFADTKQLSPYAPSWQREGLDYLIQSLSSGDPLLNPPREQVCRQFGDIPSYARLSYRFGQDTRDIADLAEQPFLPSKEQQAYARTLIRLLKEYAARHQPDPAFMEGLRKTLTRLEQLAS